MSTTPKQVVLGVDIGSYEAKGVLVDHDGRVIAQHRRPHTIIVPRPGFVEHDPETVWWHGFVEVTRNLLATAGVAAADVAAVAVSGIGPCVLPVDGAGRPLRNAILYGVDSRAQHQISYLEDAVGTAEILARSGTALTSQSAGPKIVWVEQNEPDIFARTARFVTCQTFITGRLTGQWRIDHATAAYFHPFYDRRTGDWIVDESVTALRRDQLPALGWSSEVTGTISPEGAALSGLAGGTPVLVGAPDAATEALSAGVVSPGDMMVMYGSSHFIIEVVDRPHQSEHLWPAPFLFPETHLVAAGTSTAGSFTRWYANLLAPAEAGSDALYAELTVAAEQSPPGARGLLALPYLSGERTPLYDAGARGGFLGLSMQHDRGDLARAVVEAIAQSVSAALRRFEEEGLAPSVVRAVGGGTKNPVWTQAVSDISGLTQEIVTGLGASYGNAMLAGITAGFLDGPAASRRWVTPLQTVTPRRELAELYRRQRTAFELFYTSTRPILSTLEDLGPVTLTERS